MFKTIHLRTPGGKTDWLTDSCLPSRSQRRKADNQFTKILIMNNNHAQTKLYLVVKFDFLNSLMICVDILELGYFFFHILVFFLWDILFLSLYFFVYSCHNWFYYSRNTLIILVSVAKEEKKNISLEKNILQKLNKVLRKKISFKKCTEYLYHIKPPIYQGMINNWFTNENETGCNRDKGLQRDDENIMDGSYEQREKLSHSLWSSFILLAPFPPSLIPIPSHLPIQVQVNIDLRRSRQTAFDRQHLV